MAHQQDEYFVTWREAEGASVICQRCGFPMERIIALYSPLLYFEEGRGRWIHNMGHEPVYITSHEQHKREMKERGLTWATMGQGRKGCWI